MTRLGYYIKQRRKELKLTQTQLAKNIGVTRSTLTKLENNPNRVATQRGLARLSIALDVELSELRALNDGVSHA